MKSRHWIIVFGFALILLSAAIYFTQIEFFHKPRETIFYLFQDLAFVPVQILVVTLIVDTLLNTREKRSMLKKLNMVIGVFFSETGNALLVQCAALDGNVEKLRDLLRITTGWTHKDFTRAAKGLQQYECALTCAKTDFESLRKFLAEKRGILLNLLENPNLLEHETFTDLLWAVTHLAEELTYRQDLQNAPPADIEHLTGDTKRAYLLLVTEWIAYMKHLRNDYPYLFSLAVRMNPLDPAASPVVK